MMCDYSLGFGFKIFISIIRSIFIGRLFKMYLLLLLINQMASGMFRLIGALGLNMIVAFGSFTLLGVLVLGGFILSRGKESET